MWLRKHSASMGIDSDEFVNAFLVALDTEKVVEKLEEVLCSTLKFEIKKLNDSNKTFSDEHKFIYLLLANFKKKSNQNNNISLI